MQDKLSLNQEYWNNRWENNQTGWDIGYPSPVITNFIDTVSNKELSILIPGCGNAYEAEYLVNNGFRNITLIDISPKAVTNLKEKFKSHPQITILCEDFFEHRGSYDLILEQTFLSALSPNYREAYTKQMAHLLKPQGKLVGVLFSKEFGNNTPPFGGSITEYYQLFNDKFYIHKLEDCKNSIGPRLGSEAFIHLIKK